MWTKSLTLWVSDSYIICFSAFTKLSYFITELRKVLDRNVTDLSGGELQRFAIAMVCVQRADVFMFDEPSSYLDVKQRLNAATTIRSLLGPDK